MAGIYKEQRYKNNLLKIKRQNVSLIDNERSVFLLLF